MLHLVVLLGLLARIAMADEGCYSLVDTSVFEGTLQYGTQESCSAACGSSYPYVAMKDGGDCYCLSELPSSLYETDSSLCLVPCNGYGAVTCGGSDTYTVFVNVDYTGSTDSSSLSSKTTLKTLSSSKLLSSTSTSTATSKTTTSSSSSTATSLFTTESGSSSVIASSSSGTTGSNTAATAATSSSELASLATASATLSAASNPSDSSSTNVAAIVGGVVGGVAAIALIAVLVFLLIRRNSKDDDDEEEYFKKDLAGGPGSAGVARAKSNKIDSVFDMPMVNPFEHPSDDLAKKRASSAAGGLTDPRLNPVMMGRRRLSEGSLADETDYSRKILGVANP